MDLEAFRAWIQGDLLAKNADNIFRLKGILSIPGSDRRFIVQGTHADFTGHFDAHTWQPPARPRSVQLVFIGRDLDEAALDAGLKQCLVDR